MHGAGSATTSSSTPTPPPAAASLGRGAASSVRTGGTARISPDTNIRSLSNSITDGAAGKRRRGKGDRGDLARGKDGRAKSRAGGKFRGGGSAVGLTRGERIAASHRHYDMHTAAEVLRRSPLPETAVRRKMRQIVGARLGEMSSIGRDDGGGGGGGGCARAGGDSHGSMEACAAGGR